MDIKPPTQGQTSKTNSGTIEDIKPNQPTPPPEVSKKSKLPMIIVAVVLVIALAVGAYLLGVSSSDNGDSAENASTSEVTEDSDAKDVEEVEEAPVGFDGKVRYLVPNISMEAPEDVSALPEETPQALKDFIISNYLADNENVECGNRVTLGIMSDTVVSGGVGVIDTDNCAGGGMLVIHLNDSGQWDSSVAGGQSYPNCADLIDAKIYSEFTTQCLNDPTGTEPTENPLGFLGTESEYQSYIDNPNR